MKIWQLNFELDDYDNLVPINEFTVEEIQSFDGRSHLRQWKPVQVKRMEPEKGLELSDAPGFTIPVFSRRAWECLEPLISKNVEILPLDFNEKEYFGINPPVRNSKDLENSETMTIIGPKGEITKENICIIANRHIHINTRDKGKLKEDDIVTVEVNSIILDNVHIKIDDSFKTELHINKDDAIKHNITNESVAILKED